MKAEFALLRDAYERLMAGEVLHAVTTDWNRRGVRTATDDGSRPRRKQVKRFVGR